MRVCVSVYVCACARGRTWAWGAPRSNHRRTLPAPPQPLRPCGVCPRPCPCPCPPTHPPPLAHRQHTSSTGQLRRTLQGHSSAVMAVAIAPNGDYIVSGSYDNTVRIWDSASGMSAYTPACVRGLPGLGLGFEGVYVATRACAALSYRGGVSGGVRVCACVCVCVWAPGLEECTSPLGPAQGRPAECRPAGRHRPGGRSTSLRRTAEHDVQLHIAHEEAHPHPPPPCRAGETKAAEEGAAEKATAGACSRRARVHATAHSTAIPRARRPQN